MTPAEIAALRALMEKAVPGTLPLHADCRVMARAVGAGGVTFASFGGAGDRGPDQWGAHRDLTVAAVNALPALLTLAEDAARMREALGQVLGISNELSWDRKARTVAGRLEIIARAALAKDAGQ